MRNTVIYLYCICTFRLIPLFNLNIRTPTIKINVKANTAITNDHSVAFVTNGNKPVAIDGAKLD